MKRIFTLMALAAFYLSIFAQSPDLMSYQAVVRDAENNLLANQTVAVQISILQGAPNGTAVFTEVHSLSTNDNGLISLEIGDGVGDDLSTVDWSAGPYYLKTETDPDGGSNYTIESTTQLLSVPYAKYADDVGNVFSGAYGDLSGAPTNVSHFTNDAGYLSSELWSLNGSNVYYNGGAVGIGTDAPARLLSLNGGAESSYLALQNNATGLTAMDGFLLGSQNDLDGFVWNWELAPIYFGTNNLYRMTITGEGDVGIGTTTPDATLDVDGDAKFGTNGVVFSELIEIIGTTAASGTLSPIAFPSGYTQENTRIISAEINLGRFGWASIGGHFRALPATSLYNVSVFMNASYIYLYFPNDSDYHSQAYRILLMRVE